MSTPTARTRLVTRTVLAVATTAALTACGAGYPLAPSAQSSAAQSSAARSSAAQPAGATATDAAVQAGAAAGVIVSGQGASGQGASGQGASGQRNGTGSRSGSGFGGSGPASGGVGTGGSAPADPAPAIASFRVVHQPVCAVHGTPDAPFSTPGSGVTIAWSVTGADGAALAVDDPTTYGAYGTSFPAKGQQEFPFSCTPGTTTSHTFTVWPAGAKGTSKTLTVSAHSDG
ncbi:hypothetical protein [Pseudonocardia sp. 73-21]|uniref:hypothetical protein n=1 Tax=Pseudonocardia sp. 73-21 TaxID=1895809 RepID=UPI0009675B48|nr:hypothetical protein [Pseudonocardia sp. 73-21]OJY52280.1 MAG: hypothetical protein BGP03_17675 [Pseudonocardia sp. 73-21]